MDKSLTAYQKRMENTAIINSSEDLHVIKNKLDKQGSLLLKNQLENTKKIISSTNNVEYCLKYIGYGVENIEKGIKGLGESFEWGMSEIIWKIEKNNEILNDILKTLKTPGKTKADELKNWGDECFNKKLYQEAIEYYMRSLETYKVDFSIYISLGIIHYNKLKNFKKAKKFFEQAAKYAKPISNYYTSYSLLFLSKIFEDEGDINTAEKYSTKAMEYDKNFLHAQYENIRQNALLKNFQRVIFDIRKLLKKDVLYILKINEEKAFNEIINEIDEIIEEEKELLYRKVLNVQKEFKDKLKVLSTIKKKKSAKRLDSLIKDLNYLENKDKSIEKLIESNSYIESFVASISMEEGMKYLNKTIDEIDNNISKLLRNDEEKIEHAKDRIKNLEKQRSQYLKSIIFGSIMFFLMYGLIGSTIIVLIISIIVKMKLFVGFVLVILIDLIVTMVLSKGLKGDAISEVKIDDIEKERIEILRLKEEINEFEEVKKKWKNLIK